MSHVVVFDRSSRRILTIDPPVDKDGAPIVPEGVSGATVVVISDVEFAKFAAAASAQFTLAQDDKTVTVTTVPPTPATPQELAASNLIARFQVAITRLQDIQANGRTYTAAEVRDALVDLATIMEPLLRAVFTRLSP